MIAQDNLTKSFNKRNVNSIVRVAVLNASRKWCGVDEVFLQNLKIKHPNLSLLPIVKAKSDLAIYLQEKYYPHHAFDFNGWLDLTSLFSLKKILLQNNIIILHIHTAKEYLYGILLKKIYPNTFKHLRLIVSRHNSFTLSYFIKKSLQKQSVHLIAVSQFIRQTLLQQNFLAQHVSVIHNSLSQQPTASQIQQAQNKLIKNYLPRLPNNKNHLIKIGYLGRLHPQKGIEDFIKLSFRIQQRENLYQQQFHFFIAGKADNKAFSQKFIKTLQQNQKKGIRNLHHLGFLEGKAITLAYLDFLDPAHRAKPSGM